MEVFSTKRQFWNSYSFSFFCCLKKQYSSNKFLFQGVNWKLVINTYYYKGDDKNRNFTFTFNEAHDHCITFGGKIAEPQNKEESDNLDHFPEID